MLIFGRTYTLAFIIFSPIASAFRFARGDMRTPRALAYVTIFTGATFSRHTRCRLSKARDVTVMILILIDGECLGLQCHFILYATMMLLRFEFTGI